MCSIFSKVIDLLVRYGSVSHFFLWPGGSKMLVMKDIMAVNLAVYLAKSVCFYCFQRALNGTMGMAFMILY